MHNEFDQGIYNYQKNKQITEEMTPFPEFR